MFFDILRLAWPVMLAELMHTAAQYVDLIMVGSLGTAATAAVGSTTTMNWLLGSTTCALGVGFLSYISQSLGAGDEIRARRAAGQSVFMTVVVGLFFTVVCLLVSRQVPVWMQADESIQDVAGTYFFIICLPMLARSASNVIGFTIEASGDTKTPMKIGILANVVNIVGNYFLIYETRTVSIFGLEMIMPGAGMGVIGAAVATAASFLVDGVLITIALFKSKRISPAGYKLLPDGEILKPCLKVAMPNMLQRFGTSLGYVVFASLINSLGAISTAAHTIANTVEMAFYVPGYGMQTAAATISGNCIGANDRARQKSLTRTAYALEFGMMVVSGGLLFIFAPQLVSLFTGIQGVGAEAGASADTVSQVVALGVTVLRMVALSEPLYGLSIITEGMLQGAGVTKIPFVFNILCMWGIRIGGTAICINAFNMGLVSAWGCMIADNMLLFLLFVIYYLRGRWNPLKK